MASLIPTRKAEWGTHKGLGEKPDAVTAITQRRVRGEGGWVCSGPLPAKVEVMTAQHKTVQARRLAVAMEKSGFIFLLSPDLSSFAIIGCCWMPLRLKRRIRALHSEILTLLKSAQVRSVMRVVEPERAARSLAVN